MTRSGIFKKFAGLEKHIPRQKWDHGEAHICLRKAIREIAIIPDCPLLWAIQNKPDLYNNYEKATDEVDSAFLAKDMERLLKALEVYKQSYIEMVRAKNGVCG